MDCKVHTQIGSITRVGKIKGQRKLLYAQIVQMLPSSTMSLITSIGVGCNFLACYNLSKWFICYAVIVSHCWIQEFVSYCGGDNSSLLGFLAMTVERPYLSVWHRPKKLPWPLVKNAELPRSFRVFDKNRIVVKQAVACSPTDFSQHRLELGMAELTRSSKSDTYVRQ